MIEIEKLFLYLCYHDGGILDVSKIAKELENVKRPLLIDYLDLLEATHLIYSLKPFGYGKEVLRGKSKVYLADAAIPGSILLLGQKLLEKPDRLGNAVETAFFKHVFTRYYQDQPTFSYRQAKGRKNLEVDLIAEIGERVVPFEVKYQDKTIGDKDLKGLRLFMEEKSIDLGYVGLARSQMQTAADSAATTASGRVRLWLRRRTRAQEVPDRSPQSRARSSVELRQASRTSPGRRLE